VSIRRWKRTGIGLINRASYDMAAVAYDNLCRGYVVVTVISLVVP
jgi:hypothetical protein